MGFNDNDFYMEDEEVKPKKKIFKVPKRKKKIEEPLPYQADLTTQKDDFNQEETDFNTDKLTSADVDNIDNASNASNVDVNNAGKADNAIYGDNNNEKTTDNQEETPIYQELEEFNKLDKKARKKKKAKESKTKPEVQTPPAMQEIDYDEVGFRSYLRKYRRSKWFWPTIILLVLILIIVIIISSWEASTGTLTGIEIEDLNKIYVNENTDIKVQALGSGNLKKTVFHFDSSNNSIIEIASRSELRGKEVTNTLIPISTGKFMLNVRANLGSNQAEANQQILICRRLNDALYSTELSVDLENEYNIGLNLGAEECYDSLTYEIADNSILTMNDNKLKGLSEGETTLLIRDGADTKEFRVKVVEEIIPATGINLPSDELSLQVQATTKVNASVLPSNATLSSLLWFSDDESIATVDSNGVIKGIAKGSTTITVMTQDLKHEAKIKVEVTDASGVGANDKPVLEKITVTSNNRTNNKYAKLNDTVTIAMTFNQELGQRPQVEFNGLVLTVTGSGTTYQATTKITEETKEGYPIIKISNYQNLNNNVGDTINTIANANNIIVDKTAPTCTLTNNNGTLTIRGNDNYQVHGYVIDQNRNTNTGFTNDNQIKTNVNGTYYGHVSDEASNTGYCSAYVDSNVTDTQRPVVTKAHIYSNNQINKSYAKTGDTIYLDITFSEILGTAPTVSFSNMNTTVTKTGTNTYQARLKVTKSSKTGKVTISISNYKDLAGNSGSTVTKLGEGSMTIDNSMPTCLWYGPYKSDFTTSQARANKGSTVYYRLTCLEQYSLSKEPDINNIQASNSSIIRNISLLRKEEENYSNTYYYQVTLGNTSGRAYLRILSNSIFDNAGNGNVQAQSSEIIVN